LAPARALYVTLAPANRHHGLGLPQLTRAAGAADNDFRTSQQKR